MMHWSDTYIGTPYAERNCAQLVADVLEQQFGLAETARELRGYPANDENTAARCDAIQREQPQQAIVTDNPRDGDGVILASGGRLQHIGLLCVIDGQRWILHATKGAGAVCQRVERILQTYLIVGYYRWIEAD